MQAQSLSAQQRPCAGSRAPGSRAGRGRLAPAPARQQAGCANQLRAKQDDRDSHSSDKDQPWKRIGAGLAAVATAVSLLAGAQPAMSVSSEQLLFLEAWRAVDRAYVDKNFNGQAWFRVREQFLKNESFNSRAETYTAIRKLLATLDDPFTRLLEPARLDALRRGTKGSVTGIGVEITFDESQGSSSELVVVTPVAGGPAEKAGVRAGDVIATISGTPTKGLSLYEASDLLQGPEDSEVVVGVRRGKGELLPINITRQRVSVSPVTYGACGQVGASVGGSTSGKLGYIRVATFNSKTVAAFQDALADLRAQGAGGQLVLDLRNNGGGLFPAGVQLGRLLLDRGDIVLIADSQGVRDIYSAEGKALEPSAPLAVLVNKGTASASEVLAGALKDNKRATIVGAENTFGKGLIQTVVDLSDGSGLAVTVARYQTPAGTDINKVGVAPDIKLAPDAMPPTSPEAFCSAIAGPSAPQLFK